jgi:hypothetical protein
VTPYPQSSVYETVGSWLRPEGPGDPAAQTAAWGQDEWAVARHAALVHGIGPLLAARMEGSPAWDALAPEFRAYCQEQRRLNGLRVAAMRADLAAIVQAAAKAGVEVLPLKGAALVEQHYAEPGLRPMADIDVLVRPDDLGCIDTILAAQGFAIAEETPRHRAYLRGEPVVVDPELEHPDNPRGVEVHTRVGEQLRAISYEITRTLWEDARPVMLGGAPATTPAPPALLHHLLIHTCHNVVNRRLRLIQLYDIALVAPALSEAEWHALGALAAQAGEARLLYAPLALAERAFGELAPREFRAQLGEATPAALRRMIDQVTPGEVSLCNRDEVSPAFRLAWYRPGGERLGALLRVVLPAPAELRQRYPHRAGGLSSAYLRHIGHTAGWALRSAFGRRRRLPSGG